MGIRQSSLQAAVLGTQIHQIDVATSLETSIQPLFRVTPLTYVQYMRFYIKILLGTPLFSPTYHIRACIVAVPLVARTVLSGPRST